MIKEIDVSEKRKATALEVLTAGEAREIIEQVMTIGYWEISRPEGKLKIPEHAVERAMEAAGPLLAAARPTDGGEG